MHAKVGVSPAYVLSQLSTAIVGAACFVASVAAVNSAKTALFKPTLLISGESMRWASEIRFKLNSDVQFSDGVKTPVIESLVATDQVDRELGRLSRLERQVKQRHKKFRIRASQSLAAISDTLAVAQAEETRVPDSEPRSAVDEAKRLQKVHSALLAQFHLSLNESHPASTVSIQIAQAMTTQHISSDLGLDEVPTEPAKPLHHSRHQSREPQAPVSVTTIVNPQSNQHAVEEPVEQKDSIHLTAAAEKQVDIQDKKLSKTELIDELSVQLGNHGEVAPPPAEESKVFVRPIDVSVTEQEEAPPPQQAPPPKGAAKTDSVFSPPAEPIRPNPALKQEIQAPSSESVAFLGSTLILPAEYPKPDSKNDTSNEYPAQGGYSAVLQPKAPTGKVNTQAVPVAAVVASHESGSVPSAPEHPAVLPDPQAESASAVNLLALEAPQQIKPQSPPRVKFVEAFDWSQSVSDAQTEILTREDAFEPYGQSHQGWRISRASAHWPTVFWSQSGEIPMLSRNSAKMLSMLASSSIQEDAGIVMAKVPAGWNLEFSGRSEHPLVFSESGQTVSPLSDSDLSEARYYVFLNASPGAEILYLVKNTDTAAAALPVFGGMLSFADLTQSRETAISGRVMDAGSDNPRGMGGVHVQVIGTGQAAVTNGAGVFRIEGVLAFGSQPIFVEAESPHAYPQRYRIDPRSKNAELYLMNEEQVHDWVGQLDGGVSTESGLIIAALPGIAATYEEQKLQPNIRTLSVDPTLTPESYTLSGNGQLLVKTPLDPANSRVIGVQVPEGPAIVELIDKSGHLIWSELAFVSPRVLSVIGPL